MSMLVKSSLTFLVLLVGCAWALLSRTLRVSRGVLYTLIAAAMYLVFSMTGGMNIGIRHILPVYVFLTIPLAGAAWALVDRNRRWLPVVGVLLVFQAASTLHAFPGTSRTRTRRSAARPTPTSGSATPAPTGASSSSRSSVTSMRAA